MSGDSDEYSNGKRKIKLRENFKNKKIVNIK